MSRASLQLFLGMLSLANFFPAHALGKLNCEHMIELAESGRPGLKEAVLATFSAAELKDGDQFLFHAGDFFFAVESDNRPTLVIDEDNPREMTHLKGTKVWYAAVTGLRESFDHSFHYLTNGHSFGGAEDLPALGPLSYVQPGVPSGTLSPPITVTSTVYPGMTSSYLVYVPAQYDPKVPAALMVFQDGEIYTDREGMAPALSVLDNLIATKKIPVMIGVFVSPGDIAGAPHSPDYQFVQGYIKRNWGDRKLDGEDPEDAVNSAFRSEQYDTITDRYNRYLHDEILADVSKKYNLRQDGYSRGTTGMSSGGICAFNTAWFRPAEFTRVISWVEMTCRAIFGPVET